MPEIVYQRQKFNSAGQIEWDNVYQLQHWNDSGNTYATLHFPSLSAYESSTYYYRYQFYDWYYTGNWVQQFIGGYYPQGPGTDWSGIQMGTAERYIDGVLTFRIADDQPIFDGGSIRLWTSNHRKTYFSFNIVAIGQKYTLSFNASEIGTIGTKPTNIDIQYGSSVQLPSNPFTRTGYTFRKWRIYDGGLFQEYDSGGTFISYYTANMIANAEWTIIQYKITLDFRGKGTNSETNYDYNTLYTFSPPKAPIGYTFDGWFGSITFDGNSITSYTVIETKTFYAKWTVNSVIITFDKNGVGSGTTISKDYNTVFNVVNFPTLKAVGYTFDGWSETTDGVKISFVLFTVTTTRTFYARWNVINNNTNFSFTELSRVYGIKGVQISGIPDSISISEYMPNINKVSNSQTAFIGDFKGTGP